MKKTLVPGFDAIIGQDLPARLLRQFIRKGEIPHALLFSGIAGVGKRAMAKTFAMGLNCRAMPPQHPAPTHEDSGRPCGQCPSCMKISKDGHPDVIRIKPQKASLRIDQIRSLLGTLALKPFSAPRRVVIIEQAHMLTLEAGNALLKVLEEPPPDTILILIAQQKADLLPTIVSRCRSIHFRPLAPHDLQTLLVREHLLDNDDAAMVAGLAGGSLEKARLLASPQWQEFRNWLIQAAGLTQPTNAETPVAEARVSETRVIPLALAFAAQMTQRKERLQDLFDILSNWLRDLAVFPYLDDSAGNSPQRSVLSRTRSHFTDERILGMWDAVQNAQKEIAANGNLRLTLEIMALRMAGYKAAIATAG